MREFWLKMNIAKIALSFACWLFSCIKQCPLFFSLGFASFFEK